MALIPWPSDDPTPWDTLYMGGVVWPGICKVNVKGGQKIDRKDGPGADGESTVQQGEKAKEVDILWRIYDKSKWPEAQAKFPIMEPAIGKRVPLDISTAKTAARGVHSVIIEEIDGPNFDEDKRWMDYQIKAIQHRPPPKKSATKKNEAGQSMSGLGRSSISDDRTNGRLLISEAGKSFAVGPTNARPGS